MPKPRPFQFSSDINVNINYFFCALSQCVKLYLKISVLKFSYSFDRKNLPYKYERENGYANREFSSALNYG